MTDSESQFTGRSGHLAVMAEFLHRGINVAIPEVDVGDDIFVVRGGDEAVTRFSSEYGVVDPEIGWNVPATGGAALKELVDAVAWLSQNRLC